MWPEPQCQAARATVRCADACRLPVRPVCPPRVSDPSSSVQWGSDSLRFGGADLRL